MRKQLPLLADCPLTHPGLLLEKYFLKEKSGSQIHLKRIAEAKATPAYRECYQVWKKALDCMDAWQFEGTLASRMTVGLGSPSPNENGICLSRTFGVPIVPGFTLKGAVRSMAQEMLGLNRDIEPSMKRTSPIRVAVNENLSI